MSTSSARWTSEFELLCERCGYSIEGLPRETNCPECGRPVVESLPEARVGTPWQRSPSWTSWAATCLGCLRTPRVMTGGMQIGGRRAELLRWCNLAAAAALGTIVPALIYGVQLWRGKAPYPLPAWSWPLEGTALSWVGAAVMLLVWWAAVVLVLAFLTDVESWGIRTFGRLHGRRITRAVARTITSHATAGWVLAGASVSGGFLLGMLTYEIAMTRNVGAVRGVFMLGPIWMPAVLGLVGLLGFELIVYAGVARCRFANRARPAGAERAGGVVAEEA